MTLFWVPLTKNELKLIARGIDAGPEFKLVVSTFDALPAAIQEEAEKQNCKPKEVTAVFHNDTVHWLGAA